MIESALSPYRILDLSGEIAQYCGRAFAEMGAEVIKVEPPEGDLVRRLGPFYRDDPRPDRSLTWFTLNAGKRSITLNLEHPEGRQLFEQLAMECDAIVESYQPGYLAGLGLTFEALRERNPRLVWIAITGFGQEGPYRDYRWSDLAILALGGLLTLWGEPGRPPARAWVSQSRYHGAMAGAMAGMIALYHARRTGRGQFVDVSAQEVTTFTLAGPGGISGFWPMERRNITRTGGALNLGKIVSRIYYACKDGHVAVGSLLGPGFPTIVELMLRDGAAGPLADPKWQSATRFAALPGQWQVTTEEEQLAEATVEAWLQRYTRDEITAMARAHDLVIVPVLDVTENLESEQLAARGYWREIEHPGVGAVMLPGPPLQLSETPWAVSRPAPGLGEDNVEVYGRFGLRPAGLASLRSRGVI